MILLQIKQQQDDFSPSERRVAEYITKNPQEVLGLPIQELADNSGSSKTAVIRFCKTLGFLGYRDFALRLTADMAVSEQETRNEYTDVRVGDSVESIVRNVAQNNMRAIERSLSLLDSKLIEKAVKLLMAARRIDFYGVGASGIVAQDAQQKFMRIDKACTAYADHHLQVMSAANLTPKDVAIAISWSGRTSETIEVATLAKAQGATLITITGVGKNILSELADVSFSLMSAESSIRVGAMSSRIAQLTMIDILYTCMVSRDYEQLHDKLNRTRDARLKL